MAIRRKKTGVPISDLPENANFGGDTSYLQVPLDGDKDEITIGEVAGEFALNSEKSTVNSGVDIEGNPSNWLGNSTDPAVRFAARANTKISNYYRNGTTLPESDTSIHNGPITDKVRVSKAAGNLSADYQTYPYGFNIPGRGPVPNYAKEPNQSFEQKFSQQAQTETYDMFRYNALGFNPGSTAGILPKTTEDENANPSRVFDYSSSGDALSPSLVGINRFFMDIDFFRQDSATGNITLYGGTAVLTGPFADETFTNPGVPTSIAPESVGAAYLQIIEPAFNNTSLADNPNSNQIIIGFLRGILETEPPVALNFLDDSKNVIYTFNFEDATSALSDSQSPLYDVETQSRYIEYKWTGISQGFWDTMEGRSLRMSLTTDVSFYNKRYGTETITPNLATSQKSVKNTRVGAGFGSAMAQSEDGATIVVGQGGSSPRPADGGDGIANHFHYYVKERDANHGDYKELKYFGSYQDPDATGATKANGFTPSDTNAAANDSAFAGVCQPNASYGNNSAAIDTLTTNPIAVSGKEVNNPTSVSDPFVVTVIGAPRANKIHIYYRRVIEDHTDGVVKYYSGPTLLQSITNPESGVNKNVDVFGESVAASGDFIITSNRMHGSSGRVYVYKRTVTVNTNGAINTLAVNYTLFQTIDPPFGQPSLCINNAGNVHLPNNANQHRGVGPAPGTKYTAGTTTASSVSTASNRITPNPGNLLQKNWPGVYKGFPTISCNIDSVNNIEISDQEKGGDRAFGYAIDISGDWIAISAPNVDYQTYRVGDPDNTTPGHPVPDRQKEIDSRYLYFIRGAVYLYKMNAGNTLFDHEDTLKIPESEHGGIKSIVDALTKDGESPSPANMGAAPLEIDSVLNHAVFNTSGGGFNGVARFKSREATMSQAGLEQNFNNTQESMMIALKMIEGLGYEAGFFNSASQIMTVSEGAGLPDVYGRQIKLLCDPEYFDENSPSQYGCIFINRNDYNITATEENSMEGAFTQAHKDHRHIIKYGKGTFGLRYATRSSDIYFPAAGSIDMWTLDTSDSVEWTRKEKIIKPFDREELDYAFGLSARSNLLKEWYDVAGNTSMQAFRGNNFIPHNTFNNEVQNNITSTTSLFNETLQMIPNTLRGESRRFGIRFDVSSDGKYLVGVKHTDVCKNFYFTPNDTDLQSDLFTDENIKSEFITGFIEQVEPYFNADPFGVQADNENSGYVDVLAKDTLGIIKDQTLKTNFNNPSISTDQSGESFGEDSVDDLAVTRDSHNPFGSHLVSYPTNRSAYDQLNESANIMDFNLTSGETNPLNKETLRSIAPDVFNYRNIIGDNIDRSRFSFVGTTGIPTRETIDSTGVRYALTKHPLTIENIPIGPQLKISSFLNKAISNTYNSDAISGLQYLGSQGVLINNNDTEALINEETIDDKFYDVYYGAGTSLDFAQTTTNQLLDEQQYSLFASKHKIIPWNARPNQIQLDDFFNTSSQGLFADFTGGTVFADYTTERRILNDNQTNQLMDENPDPNFSGAIKYSGYKSSVNEFHQTYEANVDGWGFGLGADPILGGAARIQEYNLIFRDNNAFGSFDGQSNNPGGSGLLSYYAWDGKLRNVTALIQTEHDSSTGDRRDLRFDISYPSSTYVASYIFFGGYNYYYEAQRVNGVILPIWGKGRIGLQGAHRQRTSKKFKVSGLSDKGYEPNTTLGAKKPIDNTGLVFSLSYDLDYDSVGYNPSNSRDFDLPQPPAQQDFAIPDVIEGFYPEFPLLEHDNSIPPPNDRETPAPYGKAMNAESTSDTFKQALPGVPNLDTTFKALRITKANGDSMVFMREDANYNPTFEGKSHWIWPEPTPRSNQVNKDDGSPMTRGWSTGPVYSKSGVYKEDLLSGQFKLEILGPDDI